MVKNDSEFFWFILKRVEPRCCAPDRCSGRTPATINNPSAPDYARVESAITSIFLGCFLAEIQETGIYPKQVCEIVLKATSTLECETADDRFNLLPLFESISHEYVTCEDSQKAAPHDFVQAALRMLYDKIVSRSFRISPDVADDRSPRRNHRTDELPGRIAFPVSATSSTTSTRSKPWTRKSRNATSDVKRSDYHDEGSKLSLRRGGRLSKFERVDCEGIVGKERIGRRRSFRSSTSSTTASRCSASDTRVDWRCTNDFASYFE